MADFCEECNQDLFEMSTDFKGISKFGDTMAGLYAWVLCEECGMIQVDHNGIKLSPLLKYGGK